jgi:hypothetical protein
VSRSSPTVRAEQARRRRERLAAEGLCQWPGRCDSGLDAETAALLQRAGVETRGRALPGQTLCRTHAAEQAAREATRRSKSIAAP